LRYESNIKSFQFRFDIEVSHSLSKKGDGLPGVRIYNGGFPSDEVQ
jgi:hypothetical protein